MGEVRPERSMVRSDACLWGSHVGVTAQAPARLALSRLPSDCESREGLLLERAIQVTKEFAHFAPLIAVLEGDRGTTAAFDQFVKRFGVKAVSRLLL